MDTSKTTPQPYKTSALETQRVMDLTALDEKKGRNLNLESNAPKGQFTPVSFPTIARYAEIYAWVAAERHPWKDLRSEYEQADLGLLIQTTADS